MAGRPRKEPLKADAFATAVARFKAEHPAKWEEWRLCPLQHGLDAMIEALD